MKLSSAECLVVICIAVAPTSAQNSAPSAPQTDYPSYALTFTEGAPIKALTTSSFFSPPILCAPDGTAYFGVPQSPDFQEQIVYSLNSTQQRGFSYRELPGLYDVRFRSFFPGGSETYVLVNATRNPESARNPKTAYSIDPFSARFGDRHDFLLKFENAGNFQQVIQLPDEVLFERFAELEDGGIVAVGMDRENAAVRLTLLTGDGEIVRYLALPSGLKGLSNALRDKTSGKRAFGEAHTRLSGWFFAPVRHKVLFYATNTVAPVLEIGPGGATREVPLASPRGFALDGFISSSDRWLVRYARKMPAEPGKPVIRRSAQGDYLLYEVDFNDGSLQRALSLASVPNFGVACEQAGILTGYTFRRDAMFIPLAASLPR